MSSLSASLIDIDTIVSPAIGPPPKAAPVESLGCVRRYRR